MRFNTIQYDIDLKHFLGFYLLFDCFNTIQYDIDLKPTQIIYFLIFVLIPFNMT